MGKPEFGQVGDQSGLALLSESAGEMTPKADESPALPLGFHGDSVDMDGSVACTV